MPSSFFSILAAAVLASSAATVSAQNPLPPPQFTAILTGQFNATNAQSQTEGPFGTRVHLEESGGDLVNATTGEVVPTILSFADNGVHTSSGVNFPSAIMPLTWSADGHFGSVFLSGVETSNTAWTYAHVETDSPTYSWMSGKFFIAQVDLSSLPVLSLTIYEETSSGTPVSSRKRSW